MAGCKVFRDKDTNEIVEVTAPNGKQSKLFSAILSLPQVRNDKEVAVRLWAQTHTGAFKKWFGNSKVVDQNGEPLMMFHGSPETFTEFNTDPSDKKKKGVYFTTNIEEAKDYMKDGVLYPVFLRSLNPSTLEHARKFGATSIHIDRGMIDELQDEA